jgi:hypothetical protein
MKMKLDEEPRLRLVPVELADGVICNLVVAEIKRFGSAYAYDFPPIATTKLAKSIRN